MASVPLNTRRNATRQPWRQKPHKGKTHPRTPHARKTIEGSAWQGRPFTTTVWPSGLKSAARTPSSE